MGIDFAYAATTQTQSGQGGGASAGSSGYAMKAATGDPAVGQSRSAHYIYDHGTTWASATSAPVVVIPPDDGPPIGGDSGMGSGSGWDEWWGMEDSDLGITPLTPAKDATVATVITGVRSAASASVAGGAVPQERFPAVVTKALAAPAVSSAPTVVIAVDGNKVIREMAIVLAKRVIPWPLWLALLFVSCGFVSFALFFLGHLADVRFAWAAAALVVLGVAVALVARGIYRAEYANDDFGTIADTATMGRAAAGAAVQAIMRDLPIGAHRVVMMAEGPVPQVTMTVYVKRYLPI